MKKLPFPPLLRTGRFSTESQEFFFTPISKPEERILLTFDGPLVFLSPHPSDSFQRWENSPDRCRFTLITVYVWYISQSIKYSRVDSMRNGKRFSFFTVLFFLPRLNYFHFSLATANVFYRLTFVGLLLDYCD